MDEKILRLFTDVGPHAKEALDSYITLQWVEFIVGYGLVFTILGVIVFIVYSAIKIDDNSKK